MTIEYDASHEQRERLYETAENTYLKLLASEKGTARAYLTEQGEQLPLDHKIAALAVITMDARPLGAGASDADPSFDEYDTSEDEAFLRSLDGELKLEVLSHITGSLRTEAPTPAELTLALACLDESLADISPLGAKPILLGRKKYFERRTNLAQGFRSRMTHDHDVRIQAHNQDSALVTAAVDAAMMVDDATKAGDPARERQRDFMHHSINGLSGSPVLDREKEVSAYIRAVEAGEETWTHRDHNERREVCKEDNALYMDLLQGPMARVEDYTNPDVALNVLLNRWATLTAWANANHVEAGSLAKKVHAEVFGALAHHRGDILANVQSGRWTLAELHVVTDGAKSESFSLFHELDKMVCDAALSAAQEHTPPHVPLARDTLLVRAISKRAAGMKQAQRKVIDTLLSNRYTSA